MSTDYDWMPLAAQVLFFSIFTMVLWYVCTDRRRSHLDQMANAALNDGLPVPMAGQSPSGSTVSGQLSSKEPSRG